MLLLLLLLLPLVAVVEVVENFGGPEGCSTLHVPGGVMGQARCKLAQGWRSEEVGR